MFGGRVAWLAAVERLTDSCGRAATPTVPSRSLIRTLFNSLFSASGYALDSAVAESRGILLVASQSQPRSAVEPTPFGGLVAVSGTS